MKERRILLDGTRRSRALVAFDLRHLTPGCSMVHRFFHSDRTWEAFIVPLGDHYRAFLNHCPHWQVPLGPLDQILISAADPADSQLRCSVHGARFSVESGLCLVGPCYGEYLTALPVVEAMGWLFVFLPRTMRSTSVGQPTDASFSL